MGNVWPGGLVIGDEEGYAGENYEHSRGIQVRGNLIVNCGVGIGVRNNVSKTGYDTQLIGSLIEHNTVVAGPLTRTAINVGVNERGRPHRDSYVRYNVIDLSGAEGGAEAATGDATNVTWRDNGWTVAPAQPFRHADDVVGFELVNPAAALSSGFPTAEHSLSIGNYRPRAGSPVAAAGLGALGPDGPEPPVEPPPGPDWAALIGAVEAAQANVAAMSLAQEAAAGELAALLELLTGYQDAA